MRLLACLAALAVLPAAPAAAQSAPEGPARPEQPFHGATLDLSAKYDYLTDQFEPGTTVGAALIVPQRRQSAWWRAEVVAGRHLGEGGVLYSLAHTRDLSERVYASAAVAGSSGEALALPRLRVDGIAYARWGREKRVVTGVGGFYHVAHDVHRDAGVVGEVQWYPRNGVVVQVGGRMMRSNPGNAPGRHVYASATLGREGVRYVSARVGRSDEAYEVLVPLETYVDFQSREASLSWREWRTAHDGFTVSASLYRSPYYTRTAATVGYFRTLR